MGLDTSHDAFHGAYSAFNRLRQIICRAAGGSFPPHRDQERLQELGIEKASDDRWYVPDEITVESHPGLYAFLSHSDCDGQLSPMQCYAVANDLESLLPKIAELDDGDMHGGTSFTKQADGSIRIAHHPGHLARVGGYVGATEKFIAGCRLAAANCEALDFH